MTVIQVPPISRSIPTPIQYQVERIESCAYQFDDEGMDQNDRANRTEAYRGLQVAEMDALDDRVRACYGMAPRKYGYKPIAAAVQTAPPSADAMRDVTDESRHELRRLAMRLHELGQATDQALPASESEAKALAAAMRTKIHALAGQAEAAAQAAPAAAVKAGPDFYGPPATQQKPASAPTYGPAATVAPAARRCVSASHAREPRPIQSNEWDFSVQRYGRPLCRDCQAVAHRGR